MQDHTRITFVFGATGTAWKLFSSVSVPERLIRSRRPQQVAAACACSLRKTALEMNRVKGAAAKG